MSRRRLLILAIAALVFVAALFAVYHVAVQRLEGALRQALAGVMPGSAGRCGLPRSRAAEW